MPSIKLTYFDSPGRAEPLRIALFLSKISFEDQRIEFPEFVALKTQGAFPLGSVPVLDVDGILFTQTAAMLRYVARLGSDDLYPTDPLAAFRVDSVLDSFNDTLSNALMPSFFERDMTKKLEMRAALIEGPLRLVLSYAEKAVELSGGPFVAGSQLTIADLVVAQQLVAIQKGVLDGISAEVLVPYPRLRALVDAYLTHPGVVSYFDR